MAGLRRQFSHRTIDGSVVEGGSSFDGSHDLSTYGDKLTLTGASDTITVETDKATDF